MIHDGALTAVTNQKPCKILRINWDTNPALDLSVKEALDEIVSGRLKSEPPVEVMSASQASPSLLFPVLLFSGFCNEEMMAVYNIVGKEIYQETAWQARPACSKAVLNAMHKPLGQVLSKIAGDHQNAIGMQQSDGCSFQ